MQKSEFHNPNLNEAIDRYIRNAVQIVYPHFLKLQYNSNLEFSMLLYKLHDELDKIAEKIPVLKLVNDDAIISKHLDKMVGTTSELTRCRLDDFLTHMIKILCKSYEKNNFDETLFHELYADFESFFYNDEFNMVYQVPITHFCASSLPIVMGDFTIRSMSVDEKESMDLDMLGVDRFEHASIKHVIEYHYKEKKYIPDETDTLDSDTIDNPKMPHNEVRKLIHAMKIFKKGDFNHNIGIRKNLQNIPNSHSQSLSTIRRFGMPGTYELDENEIVKFQEFWEKLNQSNFLNVKSNEIAIRRFASAIEKTNFEDKVVDFLIGFEAMFFTKDESAEQTHKISVRLAKLFEDGFENRMKMYKEVKKIYNIRSKIVHGDKPSFPTDNFNSIQEVAKRAEDLLRKSIMVYLDNEIDSRKKHDGFINKLDLE